MIRWWVKMKQTQALQPSEHRFAIDGWWFKWNKIHLLVDPMKWFLSSKTRTLVTGEIVNESKSNLATYRTATAHFLKRAISQDREVVDASRIDTYKMSIKAHFDSLKKEEQELKQSGKMSLQMGGSIFSEDYYRQVCKDLLEKDKPKSALINISGLHTAGRMGNIGEQAVSHLELVGDAIAIQFPITKTSKMDEGQISLHFYGNPDNLEEDINHAYANHFLCLTSGPGEHGRIFPGGKKPENTFRTDIKGWSRVNWYSYCFLSFFSFFPTFFSFLFFLFSFFFFLFSFFFFLFSFFFFSFVLQDCTQKRSTKINGGLC